MYDAGFYDPMEEEDQDFYDFMREMISMMNDVGDEPDSVDDLQKMFADMVSGDAFNFDCNINTKPSPKWSPATGSNRGGARRSTSHR